MSATTGSTSRSEVPRDAGARDGQRRSGVRREGATACVPQLHLVVGYPPTPSTGPTSDTPTSTSIRSQPSTAARGRDDPGGRALSGPVPDADRAARGFDRARGSAAGSRCLYEAALLADLDKAIATIGHDRCAVQWDVAVEFRLLEDGVHGPGASPPFEGIAASLGPLREPMCQTTCRSGCTSATATTATSTSSSRSRCGCRSTRDNAVLTARRPDGRLGVVHGPPGRATTQDYFAPLARPAGRARRPSCTSRSCPYHPDDQPPGTTAEQVALDRRGVSAVVAGPREWGISPSAGWVGSQRTTSRRCSTCTARCSSAPTDNRCGSQDRGVRARTRAARRRTSRRGLPRAGRTPASARESVRGRGVDRQPRS